MNSALFPPATSASCAAALPSPQRSHCPPPAPVPRSASRPRPPTASPCDRLPPPRSAAHRSTAAARYEAKCGFRILPFSNRTASNIAPPIACIIAPSIWLRSPFGFTTAPHSNASTTRTIRTARVFGSMATSAQHATCPPFSIPPAIPKPRVAVAFSRPQPNLLGRRLQHRPQPRVRRVLQPKLQRIHSHRVRQLVHVALAREVVGRRRQPAIRTLPQRRLHGMKLDCLVGDLVRRRRSPPARSCSCETPRPRSCRPCCAPLRTSITPAGRRYAQVNSSSRVHVSFTGLPAAFASRAASTAASPVCLPPYAEPVSGTITRTLFGRNPKRLRQFVPHRERTLRAGPYRELVALPLRQRRPRFQRRMRDVLDGVRLDSTLNSAVFIASATDPAS